QCNFLLTSSGGVDSMAMLDVFNKLGLNITVAHVNFNLRGIESTEDEAFVKKFCDDRNISFLSKTVDTKNHAAKQHISTQMAARELRYQWFGELAVKYSFKYICTAHHLNDSLETTLFNLVRGTGISGITGIPTRAGFYLRPLSVVSKADILEYAKLAEVKWREDKTNKETRYSRNFIRHEVIPKLENINPNLFQTFSRTLDRLNSSKSLLEKYVYQLSKKIMIQQGDRWLIIKEELKDFNSKEVHLILSYLLEPFGYNYLQVEDIVVSDGSQSGKVFLSNDYELLNDREVLYLYSREETHNDEKCLYIDKVPNSIFFEGMILMFYKKEKHETWIPDKKRAKMEVDFEKLTFPLKIRNWEEGDKFQPLGMTCKKKVSDFMIDRKIPVNLKRNIPLVESAGEIIILIGQEISETVKIDNKTTHILYIEESYEKPF
ncbi:MAG: tRNA lysidine(34) synthetase TilS, partial [Cyclobacteriaceae bacterium]|nr:tRNA lysidine(34) synthetase TilS [Cyclobacteriaceae bacterium]